MKTPNEIARQILDHPDREVLIARLVSGMSDEFGNTPEKTLTWISNDSEWRDVPKSTPEGASGSAFGCVCPGCGEQVYDGQGWVDTEDGKAHGDCAK